MCSIAGVTWNNSYQLVNSMLDLMWHRAPDDKGIFRDKNIVLGMGRLKIIDLLSENLCPYINQDLVLSFNGEIYNFKEIKNELKSVGYRFKTKSDTEVFALCLGRNGDQNVCKKSKGCSLLQFMIKKKINCS